MDNNSKAEYPICVEINAQSNPDIFNNIIVWQDVRNGNIDVYAYNLETQEEIPIAVKGWNQQEPIIGNSYIAWKDTTYISSEWKTDIEFYCLENKTSWRLKKIGYQRPGDFYEDSFVYQDNAPGNLDIFLRYMSNGTTVQITDEPSDQYDPAIWGDVIVWTDERNGNQDIYGYNLSNKTEFKICVNNSFTSEYPDIWGNYVVWEDKKRR